jgi:uncharacterized protein (UPF0335 family)
MAEPGIGHNSSEEATDSTHTVAAGQLRAFIERVERLEEEKKEVADAVKDVYAEAKGVGYSTPTIRRIIALRKKDQAEREEAAALLEIYADALGMVGVFS